MSWVGFFFGMSPLSLEYKFQIGQDEAFKRIRNSVRYAKDQGLNVRFTAEDATREELRVSEGVERTTTRLILKGYSRENE